ncbi:DUF2155 domain-containing protein [Rhodovulum sp. DZ06]|uniref:DUF2155 domain-containing protein n=1 Tax=Rhodovulum sp. DZ06 TaxID=3425126 RepID=UPI003D34A250
MMRAGLVLLALLAAAPAAEAQIVRDLTQPRQDQVPRGGAAGGGLEQFDPDAEPAPAPGEARSLFRLAPPPPEGMEAAPNTWTDPTYTRPESHTVAGVSARLRLLDKMSGDVESFDVPVGEVVERARLRIELAACRAQPPELPPDAYAWLRITDMREDAPRFDGWMVASAPSLSALDHQRYDVWVLSCSTRSAGAPSDNAKKSASR